MRGRHEWGRSIFVFTQRERDPCEREMKQLRERKVKDCIIDLIKDLHLVPR